MLIPPMGFARYARRSWTKDGVVNGVADAYKAVRQRYKDGSDVVKLTVTGGVLSLAKSGENPQFTDDELEAIMAAAKDYGFVVAVHAHGAVGMKRAIRAGVDSVEHGTYMDKEAMRLMKKNGTWYVPTISAGKWVADLAELDDKLPAVVRPKAAAIGPQIQTPLVPRIRKVSELLSVPMQAFLLMALTAKSLCLWWRRGCP